MPEQTHCTLGKITHSQSLPDWSLVALVIFLLVSNCFVLTKWMNKKFKWKKQNTFNSVAALWLVMMRRKSQNYKTRPSVTAFYEELANAAEIILHSFREMEIKTWCPIKYVKKKKKKSLFEFHRIASFLNQTFDQTTLSIPLSKLITVNKLLGIQCQTQSTIENYIHIHTVYSTTALQKKRKERKSLRLLFTSRLVWISLIHCALCWVSIVRVVKTSRHTEKSASSVSFYLA